MNECHIIRSCNETRSLHANYIKYEGKRKGIGKIPVIQATSELAIHTYKTGRAEADHIVESELPLASRERSEE